MKKETFYFLYDKEDLYNETYSSHMIYFFSTEGLTGMKAIINGSNQDVLLKEEKSTFITWITSDEWNGDKIRLTDDVIQTIKNCGFVIKNDIFRFHIPKATLERIKRKKLLLYDIRVLYGGQ